MVTLFKLLDDSSNGSLWVLAQYYILLMLNSVTKELARHCVRVFKVVTNYMTINIF